MMESTVRDTYRTSLVLSLRRSLPSVVWIASMAALTGCGTRDLVLQSHYKLDTAYELTSKGDYVKGIALLESLHVDVKDKEDEFVLQRFYANFLLTQAHVHQSLEEEPERTEAQFKADRVNARAMTAMLSLGATLDLIEEAAVSEGVSPSGHRLLPGRLEAISIDDIRTNLSLLVVGFYARLRFSDKMRIGIDRLEGADAAIQLKSCEELLEKVQVVEGARAWIKLAMHRYVRKSAPEEAYRFAIAALHDEHYKLDPLTREELVTWITSNSEFDFKCTKCDEKVIPDRTKCYKCGESYLKAYGAKRSSE